MAEDGKSLSIDKRFDLISIQIKVRKLIEIYPTVLIYDPGSLTCHYIAISILVQMFFIEF